MAIKKLKKKKVEVEVPSTEEVKAEEVLPEMGESEAEEVKTETEGEGEEGTKVESEESEVPKSSEDLQLSEQTLKAMDPQEMTEKVPLEEKNKRWLVVGIVVALLVVAGTGWLFYYKTQMQLAQKTKEVEEFSVVPTPTEAPKALSPGEISLEILNGSGKSGLAGKEAERLAKLGYVIVKTGNAETMEGNQLLASAEVKERLGNLLLDLADLSITTISGELTDSTASARIVLGK